MLIFRTFQRYRTDDLMKCVQFPTDLIHFPNSIPNMVVSEIQHNTHSTRKLARRERSSRIIFPATQDSYSPPSPSSYANLFRVNFSWGFSILFLRNPFLHFDASSAPPPHPSPMVTPNWQSTKSRGLNWFEFEAAIAQAPSPLHGDPLARDPRGRSAGHRGQWPPNT